VVSTQRPDGLWVSSIRWVPGALSSGLKCLEREADRSFPSSATPSYTLNDVVLN
jgi:hypothetical protein